MDAGRFLSVLLLNQFVVIGVGSYPKPHHTFRFVQTQRAVMLADASRPELPLFANFLEVKRGMKSVCLQQSVVFICQLLYLFGQRVVALPKARQSKVIHNGCALPA